MKAPAAATPMAFARAIAAAYQREGRSANAALKLAQITTVQLQKPDARITARQMEVLSGTAMQELDDEGLGAFSRKLPWGSYGMLARASLTSPNLGIALKRWCRHHALISSDVKLSLIETASGAFITIAEENVAPADQREFSLVHLLRNIHGLACWYIDSRIPLQAASFPFGAPPHADVYVHMFPGGPLQFDAQNASIRFDARYLALPLRR
ncbi:MAG: AraC family transcriptional regulator, partial [Ramlibacter sp.]|nr:AraC family transcriptional regulator [Ramlibacter sp.]